MGRRVVFLVHPGTNTRDIYLDIIEGYRMAGHDVFLFDLGAFWAQRDAAQSQETYNSCSCLFAALLHRFIVDNGIELCVAMWCNGVYSLPSEDGRNFFELCGIPHLMHWLDAPQWTNGGEVLQGNQDILNGPHNYHYINNAATAREMKRILGFSNVLAIPNASSPTRFCPHGSADREFDLMFSIGGEGRQPTRIMSEELASTEPDFQRIRISEGERLRPELIDTIKPIFGDLSEQFVDRTIDQQLANRHQPVLDKIQCAARSDQLLSAGLRQLLSMPEIYVAFSMKLRGIENWERKFTFAWLSKYFRVACFGPGDFNGWPGRWIHLGELPYEEMSQAYSRAHFGLNVMRWQDDNGFNLKPFEITLSGACLVQSYRQPFEEFFTEDEAISYHSLPECRQKMTDLLAAPDRLVAIARNGRERSLRQHTWKQRAEAVVQLISW